MGMKMLILGDSGSGKSTATRNLDPKSTFYINVIGKALPFKGWKKLYKEVEGDILKSNIISTWDYAKIVKILGWIDKSRPEIKTIIIDDAQYIMSYEYMDRAKERGYDKYTEMAQHMFRVLNAPDNTRNDLTTIFLSHSEDVSANGFTKTKMKTIGKMLDNSITIEGLFTIVLLAYVGKDVNNNMEYLFVTQSNGTNTVKSPMNLFDNITIPNDLKYVLECIEKYEKGE